MSVTVMNVSAVRCNRVRPPLAVLYRQIDAERDADDGR